MNLMPSCFHRWAQWGSFPSVPLSLRNVGRVCRFDSSAWLAWLALANPRSLTITGRIAKPKYPLPPRPSGNGPSSSSVSTSRGWLLASCLQPTQVHVGDSVFDAQGSSPFRKRAKTLTCRLSFDGDELQLIELEAIKTPET